MKKIIKLFVRFAIAGVFHLNFKRQYAISSLKQWIWLACVSSFHETDKSTRAKCLIREQRKIHFQVGVTFCIQFFGAHTRETSDHRIPHFRWRIHFGLYCLPLFPFVGHGAFFGHTVEFNSTIERKIYSQILLYATRGLHLLRVRPRNFFRLQIRSEFHSGSRVGRKI